MKALFYDNEDAFIADFTIDSDLKTRYYLQASIGGLPRKILDVQPTEVTAFGYRLFKRIGLGPFGEIIFEEIDCE